MTECPAVVRGGAIPVTSVDEQRRSREAELVRRAQAGDRLAFEQLYRDNIGRVYALCFRMAGTADLAEELAQDVFVRAWQKLGSFRGESAFSSYDVPGKAEPVTGNATFAEVRYTWTPRFFTAVRLERNAYAFVRPVAPGTWLAAQTTFYDGEVALGLRADAATLIKLSYRRDDWRVSPPLDQFLRNGSALAIQISRGFDLTSWFGRPR